MSLARPGDDEYNVQGHQPGMKNIPALTGLRFLAAAAIVFHHSGGGYFFRQEDFNFLGFHLDSAVQLFFVLSGFVLTVNADKYHSWAEFLVARFARIWPAHFVALFFCILLSYPAAPRLFEPLYPPGTFIANVLLLQAWIPNRSVYFSYNAVSWSVSCEVLFYVLFLPILRFMTRRPVIRMGVILLVVFATLLLLQAVTLRMGIDDSSWLYYINPLANLPMFVIGIATGLFFMHLPESGLTLLDSTLMELFALALVSGRVVFPPSEQSIQSVSSVRLIIDLKSALTFAVLIYVLARGRGLLAWCLALPPMVFLGEISYSVYLLHQPILNWAITHHAMVAGLSLRWQYIAVWIAILVFSSISYLSVERPSRFWIKHMFSKWRRRRTNDLPLVPSALRP
jgi:peptidoglycan/LPS O-acetylase OafA/YrhL